MLWTAVDRSVRELCLSRASISLGGQTIAPIQSGWATEVFMNREGSDESVALPKVDGLYI